MMTFLRHKTFVALLSFGLMIAVIQTASAQRGRRSFFGTSRVQLATLEKVQAELKLNDEQKKLVEEVSQKLNEDRRGLFQGGGGGGGDFTAMRAKMEKMNTEASAKLTKKLDDTQNKRLTELYVQINGATAIVDKEVSKALKVTEEQTKALKEVSDKNREASMEAFRNFRDMSDEERQEASTKLQKEGDERLLAALTKEQREQFGKMKGKEMEIDTSPLRRRRGGGQGGRGGRERGSRPE